MSLVEQFRGLGPRVATGLILAAAVAALVLWAPLWGFALAAAAAGGLAMQEYLRMFGDGSGWGPALCRGLAGALPVAALAGPAAVVAALGLALAGAAALGLAGSEPLAGRLVVVQRRGWGLAYTGGLLAALVVLAGLPYGRRLVLMLVAVVAAADTGAYFTGHLAGRHRMTPALSPGKTWEGLAGGLAAAVAAGVLFAWLFLPDTGAAAGAALGLAMAVLSVAGDLLESLLKRVHGVKDSGGLLPGHGGLLDRLDGILLAGPALLLARMLWWP
jgi:phosphatidate cytidylyltransferase